MSFDSEATRDDYLGNGTTATYAYNFQIYDDTDLRVVVRDTSDDEDEGTILTIGTHYTVSGEGEEDGGSVVLVDGDFDWIDDDGFLDDGYSLSILADFPITQETSIRNQGSNYRSAVERGLDKTMKVSLQQQDLIDRAIKLPDCTAVDDFDATLPAALAGSEGVVLMTNDDGDGFAVGPTADEIAAAQDSAEDAAESALAAAASATAAASSAAAASASASSASTSATSASSSASSASTSATNASTSATNAATSATSAATSATNAETAETNAETAETNAETAASNASTSASSASTSATNAATSETNAASSAAAAAASATSAAIDAAAVLYRWGGSAGGTADALTLTPSPALGAYGNGVRYVFLATANNTGAATINISGLGAKDIRNTANTALSAGQLASGTIYSLTYDGTLFRVHELIDVVDLSVSTVKLAAGAVTAPKLADSAKPIAGAINYSFSAAVGSSALTMALKDAAGNDPSASSPVVIAFRSATSATGTPVYVSHSSSLSQTISSGSTIGHADNKSEETFWYFLNNAGTLKLAFSSTRHDDNSIVTTTAEGGAGAADSKTVIYSDAAYSNVAIRFACRTKSTQTTAGTWASAPTEVSILPRVSVQSKHEIIADTGNGHGSTNTKIRRLTNATTTGTYITRATSAADGDSYTINKDGPYGITYNDYHTSGSGQCGVSVNSNQLTTDGYSITAAHRYSFMGSSDAANQCQSFTAWLQVGDIVRMHNGATLPDGNNARVQFRIIYLGAD